MKIIYLTNDKFTIVDNHNYAWLNKWKWQARFDGNNWYALRNVRISRTTGKWKAIRMHRFILKIIDSAVLIDHKDRNTLHNWEDNLRIITSSQNCMNRKTWGKSKYNGVSFKKSSNKWCAQIQILGKRTYLGIFDTEKQAAKAYDKAASIQYKEFANLNFKYKSKKKD